jgi:hypothetical protein
VVSEAGAGVGVQVCVVLVEAERGEVILDLADLAVGVAACDCGLPGDHLAGGFGVATCVMVRVEAVL